MSITKGGRHIYLKFDILSEKDPPNSAGEIREVLTMRHKGKEIGSLTFYHHPPTKTSQLNWIYITQELNRKGLGKQLMSKGLEIIDQMGHGVTLTATGGNREGEIPLNKLINFYKGFGFKEVPEGILKKEAELAGYGYNPQEPSQKEMRRKWKQFDREYNPF